MRNLSKRMIGAALVAAFATAYSPALNAAGQRDLRSFLVGTWRQSNAMGYTDVVYQADGFFKATIHVKGVYEPAFCSGGWEVRNGDQVWQHNMAWFPIFERHYDGTKTRIHVNDWDWTPIQVIDDNHIRNSVGVVTRISR